jgi:hypothetical protein
MTNTQSNRVHKVPVANKRPNQVATGCVPDFDCAVSGATCQQVATVEGHRFNVVAVAGEGAQQLARGGIPEFDSSI